MMIHPPMLYSGYVSLTVPFAFAIGALITRRLDAEWIRSTRRFALIAWAFLGFGLLLGARWSYTELGWGGYWAWDPVENAALMPWLVITAFLHSIMVQEKRGMLKVWNACLVVAAFSLALLGTFLVRSGVLQSIHAFGDNTVGPYILGLIGVVLIGSTALIVSRLDDLRSEKRIDSLVSRESVFLVNNLLLVALTAVIFWGTFFPLISELFTGNKASLAAPWFDRYTTPLAILLVLFTGIGPLLAWRRVSWASAKRVFRMPLIVAAVAAVALALFSDATHKPWAFALFVFAAFAIAGLGQEFWNGAAARRKLAGGSMPAALVGVVSRNRRRYGGYIVHIGIAVLLIGIAASSSFQTNRDVTLRPGQSAVVDGRKITYVKPTVAVTDEYLQFGSVLRVEEGGKLVDDPVPEPALLPPDRAAGEHDRQLLRRRGDQRGGAEGRVRRRPLGGAAAGHQRRAAAGAGGRQGLPRLRQRRSWHAAAVRSAGGDDAGRRRQPAACRRQALAQIDKLQSLTANRIAKSYLDGRLGGDLQGDRQPARHLDVDRRPDRPAGRAAGALAGRGRRRGALVRTEADALKEAKYREIRDAELDHAAGKLSDEDFALLDAELRKEAVRDPRPGREQRQRQRGGEDAEKSRRARLRPCTRSSASSRSSSPSS